jgi:hypothetical protein
MYRPYWFDRLSGGLDEKGMPVAWNNRFAGSSIIARWLPPDFNNGLDPDTTEGAIDLVYALPNMHVEYVRVEPPGIPTAFWRSVGPSHNVALNLRANGVGIDDGAAPAPLKILVGEERNALSSVSGAVPR